MRQALALFKGDKGIREGGIIGAHAAPVRTWGICRSRPRLDLTQGIIDQKFAVKAPYANIIPILLGQLLELGYEFFDGHRTPFPVRGAILTNSCGRVILYA